MILFHLQIEYLTFKQVTSMLDPLRTVISQSKGTMINNSLIEVSDCIKDAIRIIFYQYHMNKLENT